MTWLDKKQGILLYEGNGYVPKFPVPKNPDTVSEPVLLYNSKPLARFEPESSILKYEIRSLEKNLASINAFVRQNAGQKVVAKAPKPRTLLEKRFYELYKEYVLDLFTDSSGNPMYHSEKSKKEAKRDFRRLEKKYRTLPTRKKFSRIALPDDGSIFSQRVSPWKDFLKFEGEYYSLDEGTNRAANIQKGLALKIGKMYFPLQNGVDFAKIELDYEKQLKDNMGYLFFKIDDAKKLLQEKIEDNKKAGVVPETPRAGSIESLGFDYRFINSKKLELTFEITDPWYWDCKTYSAPARYCVFRGSKLPKFKAEITEKGMILDFSIYVTNKHSAYHPFVFPGTGKVCLLNSREIIKNKGNIIRNVPAVCQAVIKNLKTSKWAEKSATPEAHIRDYLAHYEWVSRRPTVTLKDPDTGATSTKPMDEGTVPKGCW